VSPFQLGRSRETLEPPTHCTIARVAVTTSGVDIIWATATQSDLPTKFQSFWLKIYSSKSDMYEDVAARWTDGANFHPRNFQPCDVPIVRAELADEGQALTVVWSNGDRCVFGARWLWEQAFLTDPVDLIEPIVWDSHSTFPEFDYDQIMDACDDESLRQLLYGFFSYGLVFIRNTPKRPRQILTVAERLSTLQQSHLGEVFTVRPTPAAIESIHIGETSDEIPLHIDLVYKQRPPDIQLLHVLQQIDDGGANIFVDSFQILRQLDPADVALLRDVSVYFVARSETVHFRGLHPILAFEANNRFIGVHYNEYKIVFPVNTPKAYFSAFRAFRDLIRREENTHAIVLPVDTIAMFDNRRTLHGRRAFHSTKRHYEGCFISQDDMKSRYRVLWEAKRETNLPAGKAFSRTRI
jgi:gamma-butyrobetaine dioxygenase